MARKLGLSREEIVGAAALLADAHGIEAVSLAAVAEQLGIRSPSLIHHVGGLEGLRREIALHGAKRLRTAMAVAAHGRQGRAALLAVARAYRTFARASPGQLAAMLPAPRPGEDDELYQALGAPVTDLVRILEGMGIRGDDAVHVIRALRSYLHGFVDLERRGGFGMPQKLDRSFERGLELLLRGLAGAP